MQPDILLCESWEVCQYWGALCALSLCSLVWIKQTNRICAPALMLCFIRRFSEQSLMRGWVEKRSNRKKSKGGKHLYECRQSNQRSFANHAGRRAAALESTGAGKSTMGCGTSRAVE